MPAYFLGLLVGGGLFLFACKAAAAEPAPAVTDQLLRIVVPTSRITESHRAHHREQCSASVVQAKPLMLLTAWHCFDGYDDLTRPPRVRIGQVWHSGRLIASGGSMRADWALIRVDQAPPIEAIPVDRTKRLSPGDAIWVLGFPAADGGEIRQSRWAYPCVVSGVLKHWLSSTCQGEQGVSGGPALVWRAGKWRIAGVVSAKNDEGILLTPVTQVPEINAQR